MPPAQRRGSHRSIVDTYNHYGNVQRGSTVAEVLIYIQRKKGSKIHQRTAVEEIVFTYGTTSSINTVARSWGDANIRSGDEILLSEMEHHSISCRQQLSERTGAVHTFR
jgi:cysteine desulfurase/selenocysteine lyase